MKSYQILPIVILLLIIFNLDGGKQCSISTNRFFFEEVPLKFIQYNTQYIGPKKVLLLGFMQEAITDDIII
jgi:hypothetical protein